MFSRANKKDFFRFLGNEVHWDISETQLKDEVCSLFHRLFCSPPFFPSTLSCLFPVYVCVRERVLSLMTQKLWHHAVTADGRYQKKEKKKEKDRKRGIASKRHGPF